MTDEFRLYPYQTAGVRFLTTRNGAILGDRVGLGKTLQAINAALDLDLRRVLVVVPLVLKDWWIEAITWMEEERGNEVTQVQTSWQETPKTPTVDINNGDRVWVIAHPEQFVNKYAHRPKFYQEWDVVIVDEVWKFKNPKAQRTRNLWKVRSDYRWGLSGSVGAQSRRLFAKEDEIAFNPVDFWALLHWVAPRQFSSLWAFAEEFTTSESNYFGGVSYGPARNVDRMADLIAPYLLVRRLADIGRELPPITFNEVPLSLTEQQEELYNDTKDDIIIELRRDPLTGKAFERDIFDFRGLDDALVIRSIQGRFIRLHQVASDPTVFTEDVGSGVKHEWLQEYIEGGGPPAVIFTSYRHTKAQIEAHLESAGRTNDIVLTYKKGSHGLNLQDRHILIQWDQPLDYVEEQQSIGRIHRTGQTEHCTVYRLVVKGTVDETVYDLMANKTGHSETFIAWLRGLAAEAGIKEGLYVD